MASNGDKPASSGVEDTILASEDTVLATEAAPVTGPRARPSLPPTMSQRYQVGAEIGRGGMGRVVEAYDTQLGRTVALKEVLPKGEGVERRFIREIEITARLEHASIVPIYDSGTTPDGRPFYVMRRVSGRPLDEAIRKARDVGARLTLLPHLLAAIDAVAHAHRRGVIHRDLKPSNILVGELGETVVIDWGLAKVVGEDDDDDDPMIANGPIIPSAADSLRTEIGAVFGTPGFMAPEQARGERLDTRGDVYALGGSLYHLLTGQPPHTGSSATEVLAQTLKHELRPLAQAAPGAPPELIAITDKAMGFEASERYPHAGALAEDVRRFLEGQLVAAHNYTPRQRVARFARRHRTALAVAALGTVLVAALAWFSVHRIVAERDAATDARREAVERAREAEATRDKLADRNDALLVTRARSLIETSPTEALALLKQLDRSSSRLAEARALAQEGVVRGVWWALHSSDLNTSRLEIDATGRYVLQISFDHKLRIWDLERRQLLMLRALRLPMTALWVGDRVLLYSSKEPGQLLDPQTNEVTPLVGEPFGDADVSDRGEVALAIGVDRAAWIDLSSQVQTPLGTPGKVLGHSMTGDGAFAIVTRDDGTAVYDRAGVEVARSPLVGSRIVAAREGRFGMTVGKGLVACVLTPTLACKDVTLPAAGPGVVDLAYRGTELIIFGAYGAMHAWDGENARLLERSATLMSGLQVANRDYIVRPSPKGELAFYGKGPPITLQLPVSVDAGRVTVHRDHTRVVVSGRGLLLVADLRNALPREVIASMSSTSIFLDDDTLLAQGVRGSSSWSLVDVATGAVTAIPLDRPTMSEIVHVHDGRALMRDFPKNLTVYSRRAPPTTIETGFWPWGNLMGGDAIVFTSDEQGDLDRPDNDGRIKVWRDGKLDELIRLEGDVVSLTSIDPWTIVAVTTTGLVARIPLKSGGVDRAYIAPTKDLFVGRSIDGRIAIVSGKRLYVWAQTIELVAEFDDEIRMVQPAEAGKVIATLANGTVYVATLEPSARPALLNLSATVAPIVSRDGKTMVTIGNASRLTVIDVADQTRWALPVAAATMRGVSISPSARRVAISDGVISMWQLPTVDGDLFAWLEERTNATLTDGNILAWPWQTTATRGP